MTTDRWTDGPEGLYDRRIRSIGAAGRARRPSGRLLGQRAAAILLIAISVVGAAYLYAQKGDMTEALVVAREIPAGQEITSADLATAQVSGVEEVVDAEDAAEVIGRYAVVSMLPGQVLSPDTVTADPAPGIGEQLVAVSIPAGRLPSGVQAGSAVKVLAASAPGQGATPEQLDAPTVIAPRASAYGVEHAADGSMVVTLLLPDADADIVASHSVAGAVALVQIPLGGE